MLGVCLFMIHCTGLNKGWTKMLCLTEAGQSNPLKTESGGLFIWVGGSHELFFLDLGG